MAYTTINKSGDYFNTKLYTGNGGTQSLTGVGFQPDFTWVKGRSVAEHHNLYDAVRGVTKPLYTNLNYGEGSVSDSLTAFGTDGFSIGANAYINTNSATFASWNWKAGTGQGSSNTDGSINTTYTSVNTTAGFSISSYTGNATSGATVGHGLGVVPKMIIVKCTSNSTNWIVYTAATGNTNWMYLNATNAAGANSAAWNNTSPTASVFSLGNDGDVNGSGRTYIAYCFAEKTGYSKFGSYTGNGNADGAFVYTGFKPAFIMVKRTDGTSNWQINDNKRDVDNVQNTPLMANLNNAESTDTSWDSLSNGFKMRQGYGSKNASGGTYLYMAFGQTLVGSNNIPATAR